MNKGVFCILVITCLGFTYKWGFFAHQRINYLAIFTIPAPLNGFYKAHSDYLFDNAVNPDMRRYAVKEEAPRHYIDLDVYPDSVIQFLQRDWNEVIKEIPADSLALYGIVPWHIMVMKRRLTWAFINKDPSEILRLSAEIGHYIADSNVPLHTTENYNGQLTNQHGIHGFWESRLPELFFLDYDFFVGKAEYLNNPLETAWSGVLNAHQALDSVLRFERILSENFPEDKKFTNEERGSQFIKTYSREYSETFHKMLSGMVERRMRASIKMVGDFWYTCWVDAGLPDLSEFDGYSFSELEKEKFLKEKEGWGVKKFKVREEGEEKN